VEVEGDVLDVADNTEVLLRKPLPEVDAEPLSLDKLVIDGVAVGVTLMDKGEIVAEGVCVSLKGQLDADDVPLGEILGVGLLVALGVGVELPVTVGVDVELPVVLDVGVPVGEAYNESVPVREGVVEPVLEPLCVREEVDEVVEVRVLDIEGVCDAVFVTEGVPVTAELGVCVGLAPREKLAVGD